MLKEVFFNCSSSNCCYCCYRHTVTSYYCHNCIQRLIPNSIKDEQKSSLLCPGLKKTHTWGTVWSILFFAFQNYSNEVLGIIRQTITQWGSIKTNIWLELCSNHKCMADQHVFNTQQGMQMKWETLHEAVSICDLSSWPEVWGSCRLFPLDEGIDITLSTKMYTALFSLKSYSFKQLEAISLPMVSNLFSARTLQRLFQGPSWGQCYCE